MHLSKWILGGALPGRQQDYDRGTSDHTGDSDNSSSFRYHSDITNGRNIDLLGGDSVSDSSWQGEDSDWQTVSVRIPWVSLGSTPQDSLWQVHKSFIFLPFLMSELCQKELLVLESPVWSDTSLSKSYVWPGGARKHFDRCKTEHFLILIWQ